MDDLERAAKAQVMNQIVEDMKTMLTENPPKDPYLIKLFEASGNTKVIMLNPNIIFVFIISFPVARANS